MRTAASLIASLAMVPLGAFASPDRPTAALPAATQDLWIEARTERFRVLTNTDERVARRVARTLERLATTLARTVVGLNVDGGREIRVHVFRDHASFRPYSPFQDDAGGITPGFHVSAADVELIAYFAPPRESGVRFAAHEYLHAVLASNFGTLPVWVNEGLAEFYSTFETRDRTAWIGALIPDHVVWLRDHMMSTEELLQMTMTSPDYLGGERRGTIYAQSWGLVHALIMDPAENGRRFGLLIRELARGTSSLSALRSIYGHDAPDSLTREIRSTARIGVLRSMTWDFAEAFDAVPVRTRALDGAESLTALGELLAHSSEELRPLARQHLERAWAADSSRPLPAALLGAMADRRGERGEAARWFAAVESVPGKDARAAAIAGIVLAQRRLRSGEPFRWPATGPTREVLEARAFLGRALEARPDAAEWLVPFALTHLDDGPDTARVQRAIGALLAAQGRWPDHTELVGGLAMLQMRAGNRSGSLFNYQRIPPGPNRRFWREASGHLIARSALEDAKQLVEAGMPADAESLVMKMRRSVAESGVASMSDGFLAWMRSASRPSPAYPSDSSRRVRESRGSDADAPSGGADRRGS